jgi:hypothetical protein
MYVGSDDSELSDLTSYYCLDYDTRHELDSDAPPFVCGIKYSSDEKSIGKHNDTIPLTVERLAHHQVRVMINPETGAEISTGEHTPRQH